MIPSVLRMKNFFSHKDSEIDFSQFNSALLIGNTEGDYSKSNGSGKSAIFESILWCLFNKSRASMMDDIIRWGEKTCRVELEFFHNKEKYLVTRVRNRISSTSSVEFFILGSDGEWKNISSSTSGDTGSKIEETIKLDYKTFVNSVYFRQNDISEFAESDPSRKKEILKSIVDISRWDDYEKSAKRKAKDIKVECKVLNGAIADLEDVSKRLSSVCSDIKEAETKANSYRKDSLFIEGEISSLKEKYSSIKKSLDTDSYDKIILELSNLKKSEESLSNKQVSVKDSLKKLCLQRDALNSEVSMLEKNIESISHTDIDETRIEDLRGLMVSYKSAVDSSKNSLKDLSDINILKGECYTCNQPISDELYEKLACSHEEKKSFYQNKMLESKQLLLKVQDELDNLIGIKANNDLIKEVGAKLDPLRFKLNIVIESVSKKEEEALALEASIKEVEQKIASNNEVLESIKNEDFQAIRGQLASHKKRKDELIAEMSENDRLLGRLSERRSVLAEREKKMKADKEKISKKLKKASVFEKLGKLFGKSGIQTILLDFVIEDLERTANSILGSICNEPSVIVLETQRIGADGVSIIETLDLKVRKDGHLQNFKSLSGGEKFRISLALRIALSDISSRYGGSSLEFLLLDEVNSPLDRFGVETLFVNVIKSLEDRYKIMVITHDESLKEKFDNVINITKINGESELDFSKR